jgi:hypothetical protein
MYFSVFCCIFIAVDFEEILLHNTILETINSASIFLFVICKNYTL